MRFISRPRSRRARVRCLLVAAAAAGLVHLLAAERALAAPWVVPDEDAAPPFPFPFPAPATVFLDGGDSNGGGSGSSNGSAYVLPLRTRGRHIVDAGGRRFRLAAVNWYGASDAHMVPGGLDVQPRAALARTIRRLGFNTVRLPYADEMVARNPAVAAAHVAANADLAGRPALDVFEAVVTALTDAGLAVVVNNHITAATWCCGADPCDAGWANDALPAVVAVPLWVVRQVQRWWGGSGSWSGSWSGSGSGSGSGSRSGSGSGSASASASGSLCRVRQTEDEWIAHWTTLMARFAANPRVVGADLRNEVRGLWGTMPWARWAAAAERCGAALLALQPGWLMVVGGTSSGNDLRGVAHRPVRLPGAAVVYSAHVYGWSGWGSGPGGRYSTRAYAAFAAAMHRNWAYLVAADAADAAPVWVGEFGAPGRPSAGDARYWRHLVRFLAAVDADWGYWALNARKPAPDRPETYGLVADDWHTPVLDYRLRDLWALGRSSRAEDK